MTPRRNTLYEFALIEGESPRFHRGRNVYRYKYLCRRKGEIKFKPEYLALDATTREDAVEEVQPFIASKLLKGASWRKKGTKQLKEVYRAKNHELADQNAFVQPYTTTVTRYKVVVSGKLVKAGIKTIAEARVIRDQYMTAGGATIKKCRFCNKQPVWSGSRLLGSATLAHDVEGCPNKFIISDRRLAGAVKVQAWNLRFAHGPETGTGEITRQRLLELGVFGTMKKEAAVRKVGRPFQLTEDDIFEV